MAGVAVTLESRPDEVPPGTAAADVVGFLDTDLGRLLDRAATATAADVGHALASPRRGLDDLAVLLSGAAAERLEDLAAAAHRLTVQRFGRTVRLFAPLYLSNECASTCTYCGFSAGNDIVRRTLSPAEVGAEAAVLRERGFRHLLLVSGEHARIVSRDYLEDCVRAVAAQVPSVSVEVQVWDAPTYERLVAAGCEGLVVYQETYDRTTYASTHLKGKKRNYDWRADALATAAHARALVRRWWRCQVTVSVPRLRPAAGDYHPSAPVGDRDMAQLACALRLVLPDVGLSLSTREDPALRDGLLRLGFTQMSAGSHTEPGGYAATSDAEPQFEISDSRSPEEVAVVLRRAGYEPVWMDTIGARKVGP